MLNLNKLLSKKILNKQYKESYTTKDDTIIDLRMHKDKIKDYSLLQNISGILKVENNIDLDYKSEISGISNLFQLITILSIALMDSIDYLITSSLNYNKLNNLICNIYEYQTDKYNNYLINLDEIDENILSKCKIFYLENINLNDDYYKEIIKYSNKYNFLIIINSEFSNTNNYLTLKEAKDNGLEIFNLNKENDYERIIGGNKEIIKIINNLKEEISKENNVINSNEDIFNLINESLTKLGMKKEIKRNGNYNYLEIPKSCNGVTFDSSEEFINWLKEKENIYLDSYSNKYMGFLIDVNVTENIVNEIFNRLSKYKFN